MSQCKHNELIKEQPAYTGMDISVKNKNTVMPQLIMYSPYICKECGKRYLVLQAIVDEIYEEIDDYSLQKVMDEIKKGS